MLQINKRYLDYEQYPDVLPNLVQQAEIILCKRKWLNDRYKRTKPNKSGDIVVPFERHIVNTASGYLGGKPPKFTVDAKAQKVEQFKKVIDYINDYNDLPSFFYQFVQDYLKTGAGYAILYENNENEIVFSNVSPLQCVCIYDYSTPAQKIGFIRIWYETLPNMLKNRVVEITTQEYRKVYVNNVDVPNTYLEREEDRQELYWKLLPVIAIEEQDGCSLFEPVITLIDAYETVLNNVKHTFEYNDNGGCKLMIKGYTPQNDMMIESDGKLIQNPDRVEEDRLVLESPTFYTEENGGVEWITKSINDTAVENHKKDLIADILTFSAIPTISTSKVEKSATEIDNSYFPLEQYLANLETNLHKELIALWENIVSRINLKKSLNFDFRQIDIRIERNVPTDTTTSVNNAVLLSSILGRETLIKLLPYDLDIASELEQEPLNKKQEEPQNNAIGKNQNKNQYDGSKIQTVEQKEALKDAQENN